MFDLLMQDQQGGVDSTSDAAAAKLQLCSQEAEGGAPPSQQQDQEAAGSGDEHAVGGEEGADGGGDEQPPQLTETVAAGLNALDLRRQHLHSMVREGDEGRSRPAAGRARARAHRTLPTRARARTLAPPPLTQVDELAQVGLAFLDAQRERFLGVINGCASWRPARARARRLPVCLRRSGLAPLTPPPPPLPPLCPPVHAPQLQDRRGRLLPGARAQAGDARQGKARAHLASARDGPDARPAAVARARRTRPARATRCRTTRSRRASACSARSCWCSRSAARWSAARCRTAPDVS